MTVIMSMISTTHTIAMDTALVTILNLIAIWGIVLVIVQARACVMMDPTTTIVPATIMGPAAIVYPATDPVAIVYLAVIVYPAAMV
jgi:hypothetical protein